MVQKTIVELADDLDGGPADETLHFSVDGVSYEIDVNTTNAQRLRDGLAPYVAAARRVRRDGNAVKQRKPRVGAVMGDRATKRAAREWGRVHFPEKNLSDRGRLPADVMDAYVAWCNERRDVAESDVETTPVFATADA